MHTESWYIDKLEAYMLNYNPELLKTLQDAVKKERRSDKWFVQIVLAAAHVQGYQDGYTAGYDVGYSIGYDTASHQDDVRSWDE